MTDKANRYLIDSNIIIYHLNGEDKATEFLKANVDFSSISRLTFAEVLSFDFTEVLLVFGTRPEAVEAGTVKLVWTHTKNIIKEAQKLLDDTIEYKKMSKAHNPYGDGVDGIYLAIESFEKIEIIFDKIVQYKNRKDLK